MMYIYIYIYIYMYMCKYTYINVTFKYICIYYMYYVDILALMCVYQKILFTALFSSFCKMSEF